MRPISKCCEENVIFGRKYVNCSACNKACNVDYAIDDNKTRESKILNFED